MEFYSNGKLLLTSEYLVLDGATALAIPIKFGQNLRINSLHSECNILHWQSINVENKAWFTCTLSMPSLKIIDSSDESIALILQKTLLFAKNENSSFLNKKESLSVKTKLNFSRDWGLGTSSTLINNIAQWAKIDAFKLQFEIFGGSAYDIACAQNDKPILYELSNYKPQIKHVSFNPLFKSKLFFVHLNQKQNSRDAITIYRDYKDNKSNLIKEISAITMQFYKETSFSKFEKLIRKHEQLISKVIKIQPIKERLFKDYFGEIKSLGAWGGDFILATGNEKTVAYFKEKGYNTIIPYSVMEL
ncbi:MAG: GYDIA family GHMP kinase [Flavobacteriaceae bacterium]